MKEISSMDFPQHGEVSYFYGHALCKMKLKLLRLCAGKATYFKIACKQKRTLIVKS
jgi:hypothetical protein